MIINYKQIKDALKIETLEIVLIESDDCDKECEYVIFIGDGPSAIRIFHSELEDDSSLEAIVESCKRNISDKICELSECLGRLIGTS